MSRKPRNVGRDIDLLVVELVARFLTARLDLAQTRTFYNLSRTKKSIYNLLTKSDLELELFRRPYIERFGDFALPPEARSPSTPSSISWWRTAYYQAVKSPLPWLSLNTGIPEENIRSAFLHWLSNGSGSFGAAYRIAHSHRHLLKTSDKNKNPFDTILNKLQESVFSKQIEPPSVYNLTILSGIKSSKIMTPEQALEWIFKYPQIEAYCDIPMEESLWESASTRTLAALLGEPEETDLEVLREVAKDAQWFDYDKLFDDNWMNYTRYEGYFVACIRADKGHFAFLASNNSIA